MPPKKKGPPQNSEDDNAPLTSVDDYNLPRSMVQRLAKGVLPANTSIQKDALTALLKSTTVFVSYLASNANDRAILGNHKTIKPEDVMDALRELEFENFIPRVKAEHDRFVEIQNSKRNDYRRRVKTDAPPDADLADASKRGDDSEIPGPDSGMDRMEDHLAVNTKSADAEHKRADSPPAAKKPRISFANGSAVRPMDDDATEDEETFATDPEDDDEEVEEDEVNEEEEEEEDGQEPVDDVNQVEDLEASNHYRRDANAESDDEED